MSMYEFIEECEDHVYLPLCKFSRIEDVPSADPDGIITLKEKKYRIIDIQRISKKDSMTEGHATVHGTVCKIILGPV